MSPPDWRTAARWLLSAAILLAANAGMSPGRAMTPEERAALDLSAYSVRHPGVSYFDLASRRAYVRDSVDPAVRAEARKLQRGVSCRQAFALPIIKGSLAIPLKYRDPAGWEVASAPFLSFEDAVSRLAAAQFVASDTFHGECLLKLLAHWATEKAFIDLSYGKSGIQTWFQTEPSVIATALAYSIVRSAVPGMEDEKRTIDKWLVDVAHRHMSRQGGVDGSCCNNHFYRRATYAAMSGVIVGNDELFRVGVSAIYAALSDATPDGALPLEMKRGRMAARYQNYATMYLVFIAQIARVQGYDLFDIEVNRRRLDDIVDLAIDMLANPARAASLSGSAWQDDDFTRHGQYLSWLELLPAMSVHADKAAAILDDRRPLYNRSLGGFMTLYFAAGQPR
jgi:poly(beta-D-mannuronate) lyase